MPNSNQIGRPDSVARWFWPAVGLLIVIGFGWETIRSHLPTSWAFSTQVVSGKQYEGVDAELVSKLERGKYEELEEVCRNLLEQTPESAPLLGILGEVLEIRGHYAEARERYKKSIQADPQSYTIRLRYAKLLREVGERSLERSTLISLVQDLRLLDIRSASDETVLGEALYRLRRFHESNQAYQRALKTDPNFVPALIRRGELFAEKQDFPYAVDLFKRALGIRDDSVEAMIGLAHAMPSAVSESEALVRKALEINPNLIDGYDYLAVQAIQAYSLDEAREDIERALSINPSHPDSLGILAAIDYFLEDQAAYEKQLTRIRSISRSYPQVFLLISELCSTRYRYEDAADFARKALQEDETYWKAYADLGLNQLRLGELNEGKESLETAFENDPFDVRVKNTLDLLDKIEGFDRVSWGNFRVLLPSDESAVMSGYVRELLEEVSSSLNAKFQFEPEGPIQVEMFPDHDDFAVRTLGLPAIGALGACFGRVLVMDSPRAKKFGEFTWGSTLWHEYVHVITLQRSRHRLPRWFSEGISVMEERRARPGWGDNLNLMFLKAIKEKQLLGIAQLNDGFHRPKSPIQVGLSYYQASKICEYLDSRYGWEKILIMLDNYRDGWSTERVFQETLGVEPDAFDREFRKHLDEEIGHYLNSVEFALSRKIQSMREDRDSLERLLADHPNEFFINLEVGKMRYEDGDLAGAEQCFLRARDAFPFYGQQDSPYLLLANLYEKEEKPDLAMEQLSRYLKVHEGNYHIEMRLARLQMAADRPDEAMKSFLAANYVNPFEPTLHKSLGDLFLRAGRLRDSIREFQVLLALNPTDRAGAYYDLSRAYLASGMKSQAKSAVLKALEIVPSYADAQDLLLRIVGDE